MTTGFRTLKQTHGARSHAFWSTKLEDGTKKIRNASVFDFSKKFPQKSLQNEQKAPNYLSIWPLCQENERASIFSGQSQNILFQKKKLKSFLLKTF